MNQRIEDISLLDNSNKLTKPLGSNPKGKRKLYIESYGCQMNFSDSEIVSSILEKEGFQTTLDYKEADLILINTCAIREKAEQTVRKRLSQFNKLKAEKPSTTVGVLGCMAERLKSKFLEEEKIVDLVAGPDAYRDLPKLIGVVDAGQKAVNTFLSREETYADISPVRLSSNGVSAFISIMRGCDNMCSFCVVPFTRGRERSRDPHSIVREATELFNNGYREVTLLGQNVDSYKWSAEENNKAKLQKANPNEVINFAKLLEMVAQVNSLLRVRFSTSHPKDITDEVLHTMKKYNNICKYIHLPAQSGNTRVLSLMNRTYTRDWYLERIRSIRNILGDECGISSDFITGFCTETEEEHQDTLSLMDIVKYDFSYMFNYSERPGTLAAKKFTDDIPLATKKRRLKEVIEKQNALSLHRNKLDVGKTFEVLIEGLSKRSTNQFKGRNSANKVFIFDIEDGLKKGDFAKVVVYDCTAATLFGKIVKE